MNGRVVLLDEVGDLTAAPGSRPWAIAVANEIRGLLKDNLSSAEHLAIWRQSFREHEGYRQLTNTDGRPFLTFEEFCITPSPWGLGYRPEDIDRIQAERQTAQAQARAAKPLREKPGRPENDAIGMNRAAPGQNHADYLAARIARDRPDILDRMKAGEFRSVRAAALEAGIVQPTITIPLDPARIARALVRHLSPEQLAAVVTAITEALPVEAR